MAEEAPYLYRNAGVDGPEWVTATRVPGVDGVHLEFTQAPDGRVVVTGLYLHSASGITATTLRELPLLRLAEGARDLFGLDDPQRSELARELADRQTSTEPTPSRLRARVRKARRMAQNRDPRAEIDALRDLQRSNPAAFRKAVAEAYSFEVRTGSRGPAKALAALWGVPATTVHRWVREARLSGDLPPGRQGVRG